MSENKSKTAAQKPSQEWNYTDKGNFEILLKKEQSAFQRYILLIKKHIDYLF
jgi:hypothetical protein